MTKKERAKVIRKNVSARPEERRKYKEHDPRAKATQKAINRTKTILTQPTWNASITNENVKKRKIKRKLITLPSGRKRIQEYTVNENDYEDALKALDLRVKKQQRAQSAIGSKRKSLQSRYKAAEQQKRTERTKERQYMAMLKKTDRKTYDELTKAKWNPSVVLKAADTEQALQALTTRARRHSEVIRRETTGAYQPPQRRESIRQQTGVYAQKRHSIMIKERKIPFVL